MTNKHLRSVRHSALRTVLRDARGEPDRKSPDYIPQRRLAEYIDRSQPWIALIESLQRRCDVLEFIDFGDALHTDRMALFAALLERSPRRYFPIRKSKPIPKAKSARAPRSAAVARKPTGLKRAKRGK